MMNERDIVLQPDNVSFDKKYLLLKSTDPLIEMPESDYLLIKQMEDGLTDEERNRLGEINLLYPELIEDAVYYRKSKLRNEQTVYSQKSKLLRKTGIIVHLWRAAGSVAAAAAILLFVLFLSDNNESRIILSKTDTKTEIDLHVANVEEQLVAAQKSNAVEKEKLITVQQSIVVNSKETEQEDEMSPNIRHEIIASIPRPQLNPLLETEKVNAYETGLVTMIPKYLENYRLIQAMTQMEEAEVEYSRYEEASIISAGARLLKFITSRNIVFERVYLKKDLAENRTSL
ncbi:MAG: hypothetical protein LBV41_12595 [Cytophagaceae bacterium]|jgi:hypothetical protein|nr:hypothetical protein [Cytophagaceae bacterium]